MASGCPPGRLIPLQVQPRPKPLQSWRVPQVTAQTLMPMNTQAVPGGQPGVVHAALLRAHAHDSVTEVGVGRANPGAVAVAADCALTADGGAVGTYPGSATAAAEESGGEQGDEKAWHDGTSGG